jgi:DNA-binding transcriptional ArsR family regulator
MANLDERKFSKYFKAFGDPSRLRILSLLAGGELPVNEISDSLGLSQPTVSRHLGILREAGVVHDRRDGQQVFYSINEGVVANCCTGFCDCLEIRVPVPKAKKK